MRIQLLTVGKQKEAHLTAAQEFYAQRLKPFCQWEFTNLPAVRLPDSPSGKQIQQALAQEADNIRKHLHGMMIALCIEGELLTSEQFSQLLTKTIPRQSSAVTFVTGSSFGLDAAIKAEAFRKISLSRMTFPHAFAGVMLMEQIYRAFQIARGTGYHK